MIYNIYLILLLVTGVPLAILHFYFRWWLEDKHATIYLHANTRQRNSMIQDMYDTELFKIERKQRITGHAIFVVEILFITCLVMYAWNFFADVFGFGQGIERYLYYILLSLFPIYRLFGLLLVYWDYKPTLRRLKGVYYKAIATSYYLKHGQFHLEMLTHGKLGVKWFMPYDTDAIFDYRNKEHPEGVAVFCNQVKHTFASISAIWSSDIFNLDNFVEPTKK